MLTENRWIPLIGLTVAHFVNDFYQYFPSLLLPFFIPEFGLSYFSGGIIVAAYLGAMVLSNPIIGHFADVYEKRKLILCFGLALYSISVFALSFARDYLTLLAINLLMGVGVSAYHPQATKFISVNYGKQMGKIMGLHGIGGGVGFLAAPIILVPLAYTIGWRGAVSFLFIPGLLMAVILWMILKEPKTEPARITSKIKIRPIILLSIVYGFGGFVFRGFTNFLPAYLIAARGTTTVEMGLLTGLVMGTAIFAEPLGGTISDFIGRRKMFMISFFLLMLSIIAFMNTSGLISLVFLVLIGFWAQSILPVGLTFASELAPVGRAGLFVGIVFSSSMGLGLISTLMVGYLIDAFGFYWSFVSLSLFAGLASVLSLLLPQRDKS